MAFDVFLSHNSREKPLVVRLAERLRGAGVEPWVVVWRLTPGGRWQDELATGIRDSRACAVFIGPSDAGDWEREEVGLALDWAAKHRGYRIFLVLLPGVAERFDINTLSPFLSTRTWVDLRAGFDSARALQPLINAIRGVPLDPPPQRDASEDVCPYRGLQAFDAEHTDFYFGRDREIQRLTEQLKSSRFLAVLGPSGSGKSSLALAGLAAALRRGALPGSDRWPIQVFTPGADPLTQLSAHLGRFGSRFGSGTAMHETLDRVSADPRTLHLVTGLALADQPPDVRAVWIVDQFEEIFTLCRDEEARARFVANLLHAAAPEGRAIVVITLRADFYHRCAAWPDLASRVAGSQLLVGPMDADGLRQAIEEPARLVGLEFEEGLVDTIVEAVAGEPGALPLLEHALLELWERRRGRMLTLEGYRDSGGVLGALGRRAGALYEPLDDAGKATARRVRLRLAEVGDGNVVTRRRARMSELVTRRDGAAEVERFVQSWTGARLLTGAADETGERWITVAHEALIRAWAPFRQWIEEDREGQRFHRQIADAADDWVRLARDESLLWRGTRLARAREFRTLHDDLMNDAERAFLDTSVDREGADARRQARRRRNVLAGLSAGIVVALGLSALAGWQWLRAEREQTAATARSLVSESQLLRAQALTGAPSWTERLQRSALLAIEGRRLRPTLESALALRESADLLGRSTRSFDVKVDLSGHLPAFSAARDELAFVAKGERAVRLLSLSSGRTGPVMPVEGEVKSLAYSDGGAYLAVMTETSVDVWGLQTSTPAKRWSAPLGPVDGIGRMFPGVFSPDDQLFASIHGDSVVVRDARDGAIRHTIRHGGQVQQAVFSAGGSRLASGGDDRTIAVLTLASGAIARLQHDEPVQGLALDRGGTRLAVISRGRFVDLFDVASGRSVQQVAALPGGEDVQYLRAVTFGDNGGDVGVIGEYGTGVRLATDPLRVVWEDPHYGDNWQLGTSNPRFMGVKSPSGVEVWDVTSARPVALVLHKGDVRALEGMFFSPASGRLVLVEDEHVWAVDTRAGSELQRRAFDPKKPPVLSSNRRAFALVEDAGVTLVGADAGSTPVRLATSEPARALTWSHDGASVITLSGSGARLWEAATGRERWHKADVVVAAFSPDDRVVATTMTDGSMTAWEAASGRERWRRAGVPAKVTITNSDDEDVQVDNVQQIAFSADGNHLAVALRLGRSHGWQVNDGRELAPSEASEITRLATVAASTQRSADRRYRTRIADAGLEILDASSDRVVAVLRHDGDPDPAKNGVLDVTFSPDNRHVLTGGQDRTVRVWTLDGQEVARFVTDSFVSDVAFSADGRHVTAVAADGVIHTWQWQDEALRAQVCGRLTHNLSEADWRAYLGSRAYAPTCPGLPTPPPVKN
jgi:WD40 repeat protein